MLEAGERAPAVHAELERRGGRLVIHENGRQDADQRLGAVGDLGFVLSRIEAVERVLVAGTDNIFRFPLGPWWSAFLEGQDHLVLALAELSGPDVEAFNFIDLLPSITEHVGPWLNIAWNDTFGVCAIATNNRTHCQAELQEEWHARASIRGLPVLVVTSPKDAVTQVIASTRTAGISACAKER